MLVVGDTVVERSGFYDLKAQAEPKRIGLVIEVLESEIYDRGERIIVVWSCGGKSYEKASQLEKKN